MSGRRIPPRLSLAMAVVSFLVAAIPAAGLVLRGDPTGRLIFTVVWLLLGVAWLGGYLHARKSDARPPG